MGAATMVSGEPASGAAMTGAGLIVAVSLMALAVLTVGREAPAGGVDEDAVGLQVVVDEAAGAEQVADVGGQRRDRAVVGVEGDRRMWPLRPIDPERIAKPLGERRDEGVQLRLGA